MALLPRKTGPLTLRALRPSDLGAFLAYRNDPDVARYQGWEEMDEDRALDFLTHLETAPPLQPGTWWQIGLARGSDDQLIGDMGLCLAADRAELEMGITLSRPAQGTGLGLRAVNAATDMVFEATPAKRIVVITHHENRAALALIARLGLRQVDTLHEMGFPEPVFEIPRPE